MATITSSRTFAEADLATLRGQLQGTITTQVDPGYDNARAVWNGMIDRYPALIIHCAATPDVAAAINFARQHDLVVAVRGGGHQVAGFATCDDGVVIDLSPLKAIVIDPAARVAHAGGGATWGELDAVAQQHGLATPGGVYSRTGIAGLTLGGGYGWLKSTYGLACDNLIAAEVVTADGQIVNASEDGEHAGLLWGLRGGGGNFGVVTRFSFRLHPVGPESYLALVLHDGEGEATERGLRAFRDYAMTAPDAVNLIAVCGIVPPDPEVYPEAIHGRRYFAIGAHYVGPVDEGERELAPLRSFAEPLLDFSGVMPFVEIQQLWDHEYPDGRRYYWKSVNLARMDDEVIAQLANQASKQVSHLSTVDLWHVGGAMARPNPGSAFHGRNAFCLASFDSNWDDPAEDDANIAWSRDSVAAMSRFSDGSRYLNFAGFQEEGAEMMRSGFGPNYDRLVALKRKYDPTNLFRLNQNIDPS